MAGAKVLIVDDDDTLRNVLCAELRQRGYETSGAADVRAAIELLRGGGFAAALVDLRLGTGDGMDVVRWASEQKLATEIIVLTGHGTIETAIGAMRAGAFDYVRKPCPTAELEVAIQKAVEHRLLVERNTILTSALAPPDFAGDFVGQSPAFREVVALTERIGPTDSSVLILGETGVGKDVVAKLIHSRSRRAQKPLVVVECASLHEDLLHSELFGHEKGAYTGATHFKHGLFEAADGGTVFLDEIGDVSLSTQVKLLRVLETGRFRHVGGTEELSVNVRIVAATNRDLADMMERGYFRKDLVYRLSTLRIEVPPLRSRPEDVPVLVQHFLARLAARFGKAKRMSPEAMQRLAAHPWPGNVRELLHTMEQAVILSAGDVIELADLPSELRAVEAPSGERGLTLDALERRHIGLILDRVGGNRAKAAELLGISERTLYRKLKEYGLDG